MAQIPLDLQERLQRFLIEICRIFKAARITLIVRAPHDAEGNSIGDLVLSNDNPVFVERVLRERVIERAKILAGTPEEMDVTEREPTKGGLSGLVDGGAAAGYQPRRGRK